MQADSGGHTLAHRRRARRRRIAEAAEDRQSARSEYGEDIFVADGDSFGAGTRTGHADPRDSFVTACALVALLVLAALAGVFALEATAALLWADDDTAPRSLSTPRSASEAGLRVEASLPGCSAVPVEWRALCTENEATWSVFGIDSAGGPVGSRLSESQQGPINCSSPHAHPTPHRAGATQYRCANPYMSVTLMPSSETQHDQSSFLLPRPIMHLASPHLRKRNAPVGIPIPVRYSFSARFVPPMPQENSIARHLDAKGLRASGGCDDAVAVRWKLPLMAQLWKSNTIHAVLDAEEGVHVDFEWFAHELYQHVAVHSMCISVDAGDAASQPVTKDGDPGQCVARALEVDVVPYPLLSLIQTSELDIRKYTSPVLNTILLEGSVSSRDFSPRRISFVMLSSHAQKQTLALYRGDRKCVAHHIAVCTTAGDDCDSPMEDVQREYLLASSDGALRASHVDAWQRRWNDGLARQTETDAAAA